MPTNPPADAPRDLPTPRAWSQRALDFIERLGNRLPDPVVLFVFALVVTWVASAVMSQITFTDLDPRDSKPIQIRNQLTGTALAMFLANMVKTFVEFPPLGLVLVSLLGAGVAEQSGFVIANLKALLSLTPKRLLTPFLMLVAVLGHTAGDSAHVLIIPLGGVIFHAAGRHPLAGIAAAFAGVSGGFSANIIPSALDPLLQGFTQTAAQIIDPARKVNPLCNWGFSAASGVLLLLLGWYLTDRIIEPRLADIPVDGNTDDLPSFKPLEREERIGMFSALAVLFAGIAFMTWAAWPEDSPLRSATHSLTASDAPLMRSVVPLLFLMFLIPGIIYGSIAGTIRNHRDVVQAMTKSMGLMGYYMVLAFFASQFTAVFRDSNVGALLAIKGALWLKALNLPGWVTIVGIAFFSAVVDLLVGSASAKWALLAMIFVPMLMQVGISPELTQAAYRIGDSTTNIIAPLNPYFPLVVVYCQRYVKSTGIGTLVSIMLPYSLTFLFCWSGFLILFWWLGIPLGLDAGYTYPP